MEINEMWPGGPKLFSGNAFKVGTDAVLLSSFPSLRGIRKVCDLGSGSGIISILLAWQDPNIAVDGIDIQSQSVHLSQENAKLCGIEDRVRFIHGDIRLHRELFSAGSYDLVVSNPPYYRAGSGKCASAEDTAVARDERSCTLHDVCAAGAYLTKYGGRFAMVHKPERLAEIIYTMRDVGIEPKRLRLVQYNAASAPNLILIEGRRGGNPSITIDAPLLMTDSNGLDSEEIRQIYHRRQDK